MLIWSEFPTWVARLMEKLNLPSYPFKISSTGSRKQIFDPLRKRWLVLTPEEWVRQHFVQYLVSTLQYPASLIALESGVSLYKTQKRADIIVHDRNGKPWMLVECKRPSVPISQETFDQALRYNLQLKCTYVVTTNGLSTYAISTPTDSNTYSLLNSLPEYP